MGTVLREDGRLLVIFPGLALLFRPLQVGEEVGRGAPAGRAAGHR